MSGGENGRELHLEFVGMLFALAIAEVAVRASTVVSSGLPAKQTLPAYAHLILAAVVITVSWVGWGLSKHKSAITGIFTRGFVELLLNLWLVVLYFFMAGGVELPIQVDGTATIVPSMRNEVVYLLLVLVSYLVSDVLTKWMKKEKGRYLLVERGWGSLTCAGFAFFAFLWLPRDTSETARVVLADAALLALVFLFRAMKLKNLSEVSRQEAALVVALTVAFFVLLEGSIQATWAGRSLGHLVASVTG